MDDFAPPRNYDLPFRGLPTECRLIIWRFVLDEPAEVALDWPKTTIGHGQLWSLPISEVETEPYFADYIRGKMVMRTSAPNLLRMLLVNRKVNNEVRDASQKSLSLDYHSVPTSVIRISSTCLSNSAWTMINTIRMFIRQVNTRFIFALGTGTGCPVYVWKGDDLWNRDGQQFEMLIKEIRGPKLILTASGDIWRADALLAMETNPSMLKKEVFQRTNHLPLCSGASSVLLQAVARGELQKLTIEINDLDEYQYKLTSEEENGIFDFQGRHSTGVEIAVKWEIDGSRNLWNGTCVVTRRN